MGRSLSKCFICGYKLSEPVDTRSYEVIDVNCDRCGNFKASAEAIEYYNGKSSHVASGIIREHSRRGAPLQVFTNTFESIGSYSIVPKNIVEKIEKLIEYLGDSTEYPGYRIEVDSHRDYPIVFGKNQTELIEIIKHLEESRLIRVEKTSDRKSPGSTGKNPTTSRVFGLALTIDGIKKYDDITVERKDSNRGFVAMFFDSKLEEIYNIGICKAIEESGYQPVRIDKDEHNEKICERIIAEIRKSKFLVADFTGHRGGVYFEAGFALGLGIPVIWCCSDDDSKDTHFDTQQYNHIFWKDANDLYKRLKNRIEATIV